MYFGAIAIDKLALTLIGAGTATFSQLLKKSIRSMSISEEVVDRMERYLDSAEPDIVERERKCVEKENDFLEGLFVIIKNNYDSMYAEYAKVQLENISKEMAGFFRSKTVELITDTPKIMGVFEMNLEGAYREMLEYNLSEVLFRVEKLFFSTLSDQVDVFKTDFYNKVEQFDQTQRENEQNAIKTIEEEQYQAEAKMKELINESFPYMNEAQCILNLLEEI